MTRRAQIAITAIFIIVIATPMVLLLAGVRPANIENRGTTAFPRLEASSVIDDEFYAAVTAALTDRLPLRDRAIRANTSLEEATTLTEPADPTLPRGRDGWLFHQDSLIDDCVGPPPDKFLVTAGEVAQLSEAKGVPFGYLIAPDKVSIYPEHLPSEGVAGLLGLSGNEIPGCTRTWEQAMAAAARSRPWLEPLTDDLRADLGDADDPLFYKVDTHWSDAGSLNQVQAMVDYLAPQLWDPSEIEPTVPDVKSNADAAILRGLQIEDEVPGYVVNRPGVTVQYDRAPAGEEKNRPDVSRATSTDSPLIEGTTVLLGDSFGRHAMELMGPYFEELIWINRDFILEGHELGEVLDGERPTAIFVEQVERNVAKGWYTDYLRPVRNYLQSLRQ
jgi:hypothetical protein